MPHPLRARGVEVIALSQVRWRRPLTSHSTRRMSCICSSLQIRKPAPSCQRHRQGCHLRIRVVAHRRLHLSAGSPWLPSPGLTDRAHQLVRTKSPSKCWGSRAGYGSRTRVASLGSPTKYRRFPQVQTCAVQETCSITRARKMLATRQRPSRARSESSSAVSGPAPSPAYSAALRARLGPPVRSLLAGVTNRVRHRHAPGGGAPCQALVQDADKL
jgi:hypothetical protein